jgi:hypothetical protein
LTGLCSRQCGTHPVFVVASVSLRPIRMTSMQ